MSGTGSPESGIGHVDQCGFSIEGAIRREAIFRISSGERPGHGSPRDWSVLILGIYGVRFTKSLEEI